MNKEELYDKLMQIDLLLEDNYTSLAKEIVAELIEKMHLYVLL